MGRSGVAAVRMNRCCFDFRPVRVRRSGGPRHVRGMGHPPGPPSPCGSAAGEFFFCRAGSSLGPPPSCFARRRVNEGGQRNSFNRTSFRLADRQALKRKGEETCILPFSDSDEKVGSPSAQKGKPTSGETSPHPCPRPASLPLCAHRHADVHRRSLMPSWEWRQGPP